MTATTISEGPTEEVMSPVPRHTETLTELESAVPEADGVPPTDRQLELEADVEPVLRCKSEDDLKPQQHQQQSVLLADVDGQASCKAEDEKYLFNSLRCFIRAVECDVNNADAWDNLGTSLKDRHEEVLIQMAARHVKSGERIVSNEDSEFGSEVVQVAFTQQLCFIRAIEIDPLVSSTWNKLGTTIPSGSFDVKKSDATGTSSYIEVDLTRHYIAKMRRQQLHPQTQGNPVDIAQQPSMVKHILRLNKRECFARALALDHRNAHAWYNLASLLTIRKMTIATMLSGGLKTGAVGAAAVGTELSGVFAASPSTQLFTALSAVAAAKAIAPATANWLAAVRGKGAGSVAADGSPSVSVIGQPEGAESSSADRTAPSSGSVLTVLPAAGLPGPPSSASGSRSNSMAAASPSSMHAITATATAPSPDDPYIATINGPFGRVYYFDKKQCLVKVLEAEPEDPYAWYNLACVLKRGEQVEVKMKVIIGGEADGEIAAVVAKGDDEAAKKAAEDGKMSLLEKIKLSRGFDKKKKYQTQVRSVPVTAKDCCLNCLKASNYTDYYAWTKLGQVLGNADSATIVVKDPNTKFHVSNPATVTSTVNGRECFLEALYLNPMYPNAWDGLATVLAKGEKISYTNGQHAAKMFESSAATSSNNDTVTTELLNNAACWHKAIQCDEGYTMAWSSLGYTMAKAEKYNVLGIDRTQRECYLCGIGCDVKGVNDKAWNGLGINLKASEMVAIPNDPSDPSKIDGEDETAALKTQAASDQANEKVGKKEAYGRSVLANPYNSSAWNNLGTTLGSTGTTTIDGVELNEQDCYLRAVSLNNNNSAGWDNLGSTVGGKKGKKGGDDDVAGDDDDTASLGSGGSNVFTATIMVNGIPYTRQQCYLKAVLCNKNNSSAWGKLTGTLREGETVSVSGTAYDRLGCLQKALHCDIENSRAWNRLGKLIDSGAVGSTDPHPFYSNGAEAGEQQKQQKKDENAPDAPDGGYGAIPEDMSATTEEKEKGAGAGDTDRKPIQPYIEVQGRPYNTKDCFVRACETDGTYTIAWYNLGTAIDSDETIIVKKKPYTKKGLYTKAIECDDKNINAWNNLGTTLTATEVVVVSGLKVDKLKCYAKALELEANNSSAWANIGCMLMSPAEVAAAEAANAPNSLPNTSRRPMSGARVRPGSGSRSRPLSAKPTNKLPQTSALIDGISYSQIDCFVEAIKCDFNNGTAWSGLGGLLSKEGDTSNPYLRPSSSDPPATDAIVPDSTLLHLQPQVGNEVLNPSKNALARLATAIVSNPQPSSVSIRNTIYTKQQCYVRAVEADKHSCSAWNNLGTTIMSSEDDERRRKERGGRAEDSELAADKQQAVGQVIVGGRPYTKCDCYLKAVMLDALCARAWANLGSAMGPTDRIQYHAAKDKNSEAVAALKQADSGVALGPDESSAAFSKGAATVVYNRTEVLAKAAELEPSNSNAWLNLVLLGTFTTENAAPGATPIPTVLVGSEAVSRLDCTLNAVEADPLSVRAWIELAGQMRDEHEQTADDPLRQSVVEVDGKAYTKMQIEAKVAEIRTPAASQIQLPSSSSVGLLPPRTSSGVGFVRAPLE